MGTIQSDQPFDGYFCGTRSCIVADVKQCIPALTIPARIYSDDCAHYKEFDASEWFAVTSTESILQLAERGWGSEHTADELAKYAMQKDDDIATIFQYVMYLRHGGVQAGFRCEVDSISALEWLAFVRPDVLAEIRRREKAA
jgi:hypothetical protein